MELSAFMTPNPITVTRDVPIDDVMILMDERHLRHVPVMEDTTVVGIVTDRDLLLASAWLPLADREDTDDGETHVAPRTAGEIMQFPAICAQKDEAPYEAAQEMIELRIGALPVLDGDQLIGIVTETDFLKAFLQQCADSDTGAKIDGRVEQLMHTDLITVGPNSRIDEVVDISTKNHVRHVPVVADGTLVGILSDRDLRLALGKQIIEDERGEKLGRMEVPTPKVIEFMTRNVVHVEIKTRLSVAASLMIEHRFSALLVKCKEELRGILTETDILAHFSKCLEENLDP